MPKEQPKEQPPQDETLVDPPTPEEDETVAVAYRDLTFTVPKDADDWNTDDIEIVYKGLISGVASVDAFDVVRACIGAEEFARFKAKYLKFPEFKAFRDQLIETITKECTGF